MAGRPNEINRSLVTPEAISIDLMTDRKCMCSSHPKGICSRLIGGTGAKEAWFGRLKGVVDVWSQAERLPTVRNG